ncbi:hypothetical protein JEQ12_008661 [Ovis aries]|uniref:Uncharacterized protein n=1 Tax=Ovis aries TaxID=9940 RepID=A0A836AC31_SHEEP|nr:hypothetical protein JEQ12_008661 [Ovis aries]
MHEQQKKLPGQLLKDDSIGEVLCVRSPMRHRGQSPTPGGHRWRWSHSAFGRRAPAPDSAAHDLGDLGQTFQFVGNSIQA